MDLRRGFRRVTLFLAIVAAVFGAFLAYIILIEPLQYWDVWALVTVTILAGLAGAVGGYCGVWLVYRLIEWFILGFSDIQPISKGRDNAMNPKRGFRRITLVLAIVTAVFCAFFAGALPIEKHLFEQRKANEQVKANDFEKYHAKTFTVVKIVDGDTIDIDSPDIQYNHTRIRLWGITTPETINQQATEFATKLALGKQVEVYLEEHKTRDKFGRLVAYVQLPDSRFLNEVLLADGFACADLRFQHSFYHKYSQLEAIARKQKKGWYAIEDLPAIPKSDVTGERLLGLDDIEKPQQEAELKELENGFWVTLSKGSLIGLSILAGLAGAGVGFGGIWLGYCVMWLFYLLIRWVVSGFCGDQN